MKSSVKGAVVLASLSLSVCLATADDLGSIVALAIDACNSREMLLESSFTNRVELFRNETTNVEERCAADLALAVSAMQRYDEYGDIRSFDLHQRLVSNLVFSCEMPDTSWVRYAAAFEYSCGLNSDGRNQAGFYVATNHLSRMSAFPPDMTQTNFWSGIMHLERCGDMDMESAFRVLAAVELARQGRLAELGAYTNSLPESALAVFEEEVQ